MRILQINAVYKTMSTGRITMELHKYFQAKGIDSYVAYGTKNTDNSHDPHVFQIGNWIDHKIHAVAYRVDKMQGCHSSLATMLLIKKVKRINPNVILTHNLHSNYLNVPLLFRELHKLGIKVFVDLHDCWFLTGGCYHYTATGCEQWLEGCLDCPMLGNAAKRKHEINQRLFNDTNPVIIATSKWIESEAKRSLLGRKCRIEMIYDWIDMETFYPRTNNSIREKYKISTERIILSVSTMWNLEKGLQEVISLANSLPNCTIIMVGHQPPGIQYPPNVITIEFTDSKEELAELYSVADVFFNPSKQETFGLVSGEALACGTPLVVYNTTACPEFVTEYTGIKMEKNEDIVTAVNAAIDLSIKYGREFIRNKCVEFAKCNFDMERNIEKYLDLFNNS